MPSENATGGTVALSEVLRNLPDRLPEDVVTVGNLLEALSPRSYPLIMLVLAFPNLVPIPAPGLSALLGLPLTVLTLQMTLGYERPVLPRFLTRRKIDRAKLVRACERAAPVAERIEGWSRPRLLLLLHPPAGQVIGLIATLLSVIILLPVPFGNALPAAAICLIALGQLRGDGLTILIGFVVAAAGLAFIVLFAGTLTALIKALIWG